MKKAGQLFVPSGARGEHVSCGSYLILRIFISVADCDRHGDNHRLLGIIKC